MRQKLTLRILSLILLLACGLASPAAAQLQRTDVPDAAKGTGVDSHLGETIDTDIKFRNDNGQFIRLGDIFDGQQPVILSFNYSNCPKLCSVQLENITLAFRQIDFEVGKDFQMISVSIDPLEQYSRARSTKEKFVQLYNRPESMDGWHFLTGKKDSIEVLADQCGFRYKYVPHQKLYSHPPVFILLSPTGKIVRYIHGLDYQPVTVQRALIEAAEGKIGSPVNRFTYITGCFLYDESSGQYTPQAMAIMRIGGVVTILALLVGLIPYWFFRSKGKTAARAASDLKPATQT